MTNSSENMQQSAKENMLFGQMIPHRINDLELLKAIQKVDKERFLPERLKNRAYADESLLIDSKTFLFSPYVFAKLVCLAEVKKEDFVLNLKSGTGYSASVLSHLAKAVIAIEPDSILCQTAETNFIEMQCDNVASFCMPPEKGFSSQGPFDVIFIEGVISKLSDEILSQIAENGRLICVLVQSLSAIGKVTKVVKKNGNLSFKTVFELDLSSFLPAPFYEKFQFETIS